VTRRPLRIVVSGMVAGVPYHGGATWAVLQYVLGFRALGHDVLLIEPVLETSIAPGGVAFGAPDNAAYFRDVARQFGLGESAALLRSGSRDTVGVDYGTLAAWCREADVHINISGMLDDPELTDAIPTRVYLDLDPAFNQLWAASGEDMHFDGHTHFATIGLAIGTPGCDVPTCGRDWIPTLQPIVLAFWPMAPRTPYDALTTVGNWRSYGSITRDGVFYGQKAHTIREYVTLPRRTRDRLRLAIAIDAGETKDLATLAEHSWRFLDPGRVARDPGSYQQFIQRSKAELGFAKSGYIVSRCGWFSDRSLCYLASGRPVLATETGFSAFLPTGEGLLPFSTEDELLSQIDALNAAYTQHAHAARALAEEYFDSQKVLSRLLQRVGAA
jgi:hypothetical protein